MGSSHVSMNCLIFLNIFISQFELTFLFFSQNHYKDAFKELRCKKILSPDEIELIPILEERFDDAKKQKKEVVDNLRDIEQSISETVERISMLESELDKLKNFFCFDDFESSGDKKENMCALPRSAKRKKMQRKTHQKIEDEVAEVFVDIDTLVDVTVEEIDLCMEK